VQQFSVDLQRELPFGIALETGYVGSRSANFGLNATNLNINALEPGLLGTVLTSAVANPFYQHGGTGIIGGATVGHINCCCRIPLTAHSTFRTPVITMRGTIRRSSRFRNASARG
jgi:hypothetical protein